MSERVSTRTALAAQREMANAGRKEVFSDGGDLKAQTRRGKTSIWNIYLVTAGYRDDVTRKKVGELVTRNVEAVTAVLNALEPFHRKETL